METVSHVVVSIEDLEGDVSVETVRRPLRQPVILASPPRAPEPASWRGPAEESAELRVA